MGRGRRIWYFNTSGSSISIKTKVHTRQTKRFCVCRLNMEAPCYNVHVTTWTFPRTDREELIWSHATNLQKLATGPLSPMCNRFDTPELHVLAYMGVFNLVEQSLSWEAYSCWTSQVPAMCSRQPASNPCAYPHEWLQYTLHPVHLTSIPTQSIYT